MENLATQVSYHVSALSCLVLSTAPSSAELRDRAHHPPRPADDLSSVLTRARTAGVTTSILTGGSLSESKEALELAQKHGQSTPSASMNELTSSHLAWSCAPGLYSTVGLHPTRTSEMDEDPAGYLAQLSTLIESGNKGSKGKGRVVAIGECGLGQSSLCCLVLSSAFNLTPFFRCPASRLRPPPLRPPRHPTHPLRLAPLPRAHPLPPALPPLAPPRRTHRPRPDHDRAPRRLGGRGRSGA